MLDQKLMESFLSHIARDKRFSDTQEDAKDFKLLTLDWIKNSSFGFFFHFFNFDTHGHLHICIKMHGEKENFKKLETTGCWASKTSTGGVWTIWRSLGSHFWPQN